MHVYMSVCMHAFIPTYIIYFGVQIFNQIAELVWLYGLASHRNTHSLVQHCRRRRTPPPPRPTHIVVFFCHSQLFVYLKLGWKQSFVPRRRVKEQLGIYLSGSEITPANNITVVLFVRFKCLRLLCFSRKSSFELCTYHLRPIRVLFQTRNSCMVYTQCVVC